MFLFLSSTRKMPKTRIILSLVESLPKNLCLNAFADDHT